jgi:hypothetical protein
LHDAVGDSEGLSASQQLALRGISGEVAEVKQFGSL